MIDETPVQLDQIEIWQHALEEGHSLIEEAANVQAAAKQAQLLRHWSEAAEKFRQAHSLYTTARSCLAIPAAIEESAWRRVKVFMRCSGAGVAIH